MPRALGRLMPRVGTILFYWLPRFRFGTPALPLPGLPFIYCSSLCLYWASSFSKVSKSSLSVEIVFCVSSRSLSLPSIWLISNFLSFLLSSSSCLHLRAFFKITSLLAPTPDPWFEFAAFCSDGYWPTPPTALTIPFPEPAELLGWFCYCMKELMESEFRSLRIKFLRALKSSAYCIRASLFLCIIFLIFSLVARASSTPLRDKLVSLSLIAISCDPCYLRLSKSTWSSWPPLRGTRAYTSY